MDEIESLGMPSGEPSLALGHIDGLALPRGLGQDCLIEWAGRPDEEKKQLAKDFESVFLSKVFDQVKESIGNWGLEEDGASQQIQGLFWNYLAQDVADKGGFGLWRDIYQHFKEMEGADGGGASFDGKM